MQDRMQDSLSCILYLAYPSPRLRAARSRPASYFCAYLRGDCCAVGRRPYQRSSPCVALAFSCCPPSRLCFCSKAGIDHVCVLSEKRVDQSHDWWLLIPLSGLFSACLGFAWGGVQPPAPPWALTALRRALPCPLYMSPVPR